MAIEVAAEPVDTALLQSAAANPGQVADLDSVLKERRVNF